MTLADLAEEYLAQHDGQPETTAKLRWLLTKSTAAFGSTPLTDLDAARDRRLADDAPAPDTASKPPRPSGRRSPAPSSGA